ncbi:MAG: hypothetical protein IPP60_08375 [Sphingobacteriales bacterium]|nr:hypothetical protein [Sphingobacteriales bacterium]
MNPYENKDIRAFLESIPEEELEMHITLLEEEHDKVYNDFINDLNIGKCFLCGEKMDSIDKSNPCFHWFTYPKGIKKKYFDAYLKNPIEFFKLDCYFRWLANVENPIVNVNDLEENTSTTSFLETTIKYKNIEWAFSVGQTDIEGHQNSHLGSEPHFHIQMKVDGNVFLRFNDFHIPFSDLDLFKLAYIEQSGDKSFLNLPYGLGMSILENEELYDIIDEELIVDPEEKDESIRRITTFIASEEQSFSTELLLQALEESERTKRTLGGTLQKLMSDAKIETSFSVYNGMKMTKRSGKK